MGRERVGEETFLPRQAPSQRVADAEVGGAALDGRGRRARAFYLREPARQRQWVAGELRAHGIGQVLALATHRQREDLRDDRREDPREDPHHEQDGEQRARAALLPSAAAGASPASPPPPPPQLPPPRLVPPRRMRVAPSCIRATAPTSAASIVINRTSRFFTCPSSCPTTAWSSSRLQRSSRPRVTAMCACSGSVPVANALGSGSSTIQIRGRGTPAAMAISSTTLTSCFSCGSVGSTMARAPVDQSTF